MLTFHVECALNTEVESLDSGIQECFVSSDQDMKIVVHFVFLDYLSSFSFAMERDSKSRSPTFKFTDPICDSRVRNYY